MAELKELATGLLFPEGPVAMEDGSVIVTEIARGTITRVGADSATEVVAEPGGGPNGAAVGPDGKLYVCNNGNAFDYVDMDGMMLPVQPPSKFEGGRIERVDIGSGEVEVLYKECDGRPLRAPNDIVFDAHGGFWFTDHRLRVVVADHRARRRRATAGPAAPQRSAAGAAARLPVPRLAGHRWRWQRVPGDARVRWHHVGEPGRRLRGRLRRDRRHSHDQH